MSLALMSCERISSVLHLPLLNDGHNLSKTSEHNACLHLEITDTNVKLKLLISVLHLPLLNDGRNLSKTSEHNACLHLEITDTNVKLKLRIWVTIFRRP